MGFFDLIMGNNASGPSSPGASGAAMVSNPLGAIAGPSSSSVDDIDPQTGLRVGDIRNGQMQTLGQIGLLLAAAGQGGQSRAQRAATIAAIAPTMGQMNQHILNNAQARLIQQKATRENEQLTRQDEALKQIMADPKLPQEFKNFAQVNPQGAMAHLASVNMPTPTDKQREVADLMRAGFSQKDAFDRAYGTGEKWVAAPDGSLYNSLTGERKQESNIDPLSGQPASQPQGTPPAPAAPPRVPSNAGDAFGLSAAPLWAGIAGLTGNSTSPDVQKKLGARSEMNSLNDELTGLLAADLPGMKSKYTAERITRELPQIGSWTTGADTAAAMYEGKLPQLNEKKQEAFQAYNSSRSLGRMEDAKRAAETYRQLDSAIAKTGEAIKALRQNQAGQAYTPQLDAARRAVSGGQQGNSSNMTTIDKARQILGQ